MFIFFAVARNKRKPHAEGMFINTITQNLRDTHIKVMNEGSLPVDLLRFSWIDEENNIPVYRQRDQRSKDIFQDAFQRCQTTFHESLNQMKTHLRQCNIKICCDTPQVKSNVEHVSASYLAKLLNSESPIITMKTNKTLKKQSM